MTVRVGDKMVHIYSIGRSAEIKHKEVTVSAVGRKWISIGEGRGRQRFDVTTRKYEHGSFFHGGTSEIHESLAAWNARQQHRELIADLTRQLRSHSLDRELEAVPAEDIRAAAKLLGIKLEKGQ